MDIFINDCLSLPEQVEKNRRDIIDIINSYFLEHLNYKEIELDYTEWVYNNNGIYKYTYNDYEITEDSLVIIITETSDIKLININSINYGFVLESKTKPSNDTKCYIWFNNKNINV